VNEWQLLFVMKSYFAMCRSVSLRCHFLHVEVRRFFVKFCVR